MSKTITQREIYAQIRKPMPPPTKAFKMAKPYNRKDKSWRNEE